MTRPFATVFARTAACLHALRRSRRGTATIEFALCSLFLFGTIMVALDFGAYNQQKLRLGQAVETGAIMAYNQQVGSATGAISTYVQSYAGTKAVPVVTITCNGSTDTANCASGKCSCLDAAGNPSGLADCQATKRTWASGGVEGNYLKITATAAYAPMVVPDRYLGGSNIVQSATVRLQ